MPNNINPYLEEILTARYGEQVRGAIHDALEQTYADVDKPNVDTSLSVRGDAADAQVTGQRIESLESGYSELISDFAGLGYDVNTLEDTVSNLVDVTNSVSGKAAEAKVTGDTLEDHIQRINALTEDVEDLETDLGEANNAIGRVRTQVLGLDDYVSNLVDVTNSVSGKAAEAKVTGDTLADHIQRINALAEDVEDLEAADSELESDFEELVVVSETEPQTEATKVWIKSNTSEVQIPTFAEFSDLRDASVFKNGGKQVKPENLSFVTFGSNLYDGHALYVGRINGGTGELRPTSTSYVTTDFIPLNIMSGTYLLAEKLGNLNHNAYGFYDANLGFISGAEATETNAVEIPINAEYVRVSYTSGTTPDQIMITRSNNTTAVPCEAFSFKIPEDAIDTNGIDNKMTAVKATYVYRNGGAQVKPENLSFVTFGNNLYDGHALYVGRIDGQTGELKPQSSNYLTTDFIPLNIMSGTYLLAEKLGNLNHNAYGFYDLTRNFISGVEATETNAVEIPSGAEYVRVSYTSSTTPDQIMITRSNNTTAVPYEPFSFEIPASVINNNFRSSLNKTQLGNELNTYLSNWTAAGGSQWDSTKSQYNIPVGGSISKQFTVEANTAYMIVLTMSADPSPYTPMLTIDSRLVVSLGDASINIFGANDGTFAVRLTPTVGGAVNGVIASAENWTGALTSVSIRKVVEYPVPSLQLNNNGLYLNGYNTGFGTGLRKITNDYNDNGRVFYGTINTSIGYHAQDEIDTGRYNNAYGYGSQRNMTNGSSNNAYGTHTQEDATTAMYNNAFGSSSQRRLTIGCWNVAMGNESQRDITDGCNNVGIGRRAQNDINSGQRNIAIGALAGFICTGRGSVSTVNEEDQVLIGCMATQLRRNSNRGIAIGSYSGCGNNGIAIGYGAEADDNDITIGTATNTGTVKIAGKTISFNQDGTVTWS